MDVLIEAKARLMAVVLLLLAGCATPGRRPQLADWQSEESAPPGGSDLASAVAPAAAEVSPAIVPEKPLIPIMDKWVPLNRWCKINRLPPPSLVSKTPPTFALSTSHGVFVLRPGSQLAQWDGLEMRLGFAPQLINGEPFVRNLDLEKTISPLITSIPRPSTDGPRKPVIVLDPGHGGDDPGTQSVLGGRNEKDYTLDWALRLEALLITNGWQVLLTRTNDHELSLSNRVLFAQNHKADLFVSLHFNSAAPNNAEAGLETYCLTPAGMPSSVTRGYHDDPGATFPNNAFDPENLQYAMRVHRALLQINGRLDRGVRRARYLGVLRGQQRPAILVEGGYLSNPREARLIDEPGYRQKLAGAVAKALALEPRVLQTSTPSEAALGKNIVTDPTLSGQAADNDHSMP